MESVFLYRVIAETDPPRNDGAVYKAGERGREPGGYLGAEIAKRRGSVPASFTSPGPGRLVATLIRHLGAARLKAVLSAMKVRGMSAVGGPAPSGATGHPLPHSVAEIGLRHRGKLAGGNLRAAVFGASDGWCRTVSDPGRGGRAAMKGGSCSSPGWPACLPEHFRWPPANTSRCGRSARCSSTRSAPSARAGQYPVEEAAELSLIYQARGLGKDDADRMAGSIVADPGTRWTRWRAKSSVWIQRAGSPLAAAAFSFASFAVGAAVPLAPFVVAARRDGAADRGRADRRDAVRRRLRDQALFTGRQAVRGARGCWR